MGRKSALTPDEWVIVERRVLINGESVNSIAKELGINEATIRRKVKPNKSESDNNAKSLKELALDKISADNAQKQISEQIAELPIAKQQIVNELARKLSNVSSHLLSAGEYGAMTAHRLSILANSEVQKIDDINPLESIEALKGVSALTRIANDSAEIGLNLLKANKEAVDGLNKADETPEPKQIVFTVRDARA